MTWLDGLQVLNVFTILSFRLVVWRCNNLSKGAIFEYCLVRKNGREGLCESHLRPYFQDKTYSSFTEANKTTTLISPTKWFFCQNNVQLLLIWIRFPSSLLAGAFFSLNMLVLEIQFGSTVPWTLLVFSTTFKGLHKTFYQAFWECRSLFSFIGVILSFCAKRTGKLS